MTGTPNGVVASILLEELKAVYKDFDYEAISISFSKNEQKEECVHIESTFRQLQI